MAVMVEVTVKTVIADNAANNMMAGYCKYSMVGKIFYWQVQLTLYINWHHAVSDISQQKTLKKCFRRFGDI